MYTTETKNFIYKIIPQKILVFTKDNILIRKIELPKKEKVKGFDYMYYEGTVLKVFFDTNDNYQYKATFDEETFEFSEWGVTK